MKLLTISWKIGLVPIDFIGVARDQDASLTGDRACRRTMVRQSQVVRFQQIEPEVVVPATGIVADGAKKKGGQQMVNRD
jgi:hypothetical protein